MITMSLREISRLKTIQAVAEGNLRAVTAAAQLGLSRRQIDRLADRYRDDRPSGLVSKKRGLRHHQLPASAVDLALSIIRDRYPDFGPTLACEKLRERHGILLAKETIRKLMTEAGLWIPRKQRPPSIYQPRNRRTDPNRWQRPPLV